MNRLRRGASIASSGPCGRRRAGHAGISLVELLIAASLTSVVLACAWPWLWNACHAGLAIGNRAESSSSARAAAHTIAADLRHAVALASPTPGQPPERALCLRHQRPGEQPSTVVIAWDPTRRVLWRNASGTYIADHVTQCEVSYFALNGARMDSNRLADANGLRSVARIRVDLVVTVGQASQAVRVDAPIGTW
ncbi:MAG: hypothetical protein R2826_05410 [Thermoleophilia bacterium]